jgi:hypothetical protein
MGWEARIPLLHPRPSKPGFVTPPESIAGLPVRKSEFGGIIGLLRNRVSLQLLGGEPLQLLGEGPLPGAGLRLVVVWVNGRPAVVLLLGRRSGMGGACAGHERIKKMMKN